jgi:glycosyltransferase involved in cell wall biosynthesis
VRTSADARPLLGRRSKGSGAGRLLFVCWYDPHGVATIYENIASWQKLSEFALEIVNLWPIRSHPSSHSLSLPATIDLSEYDGVIIHAAVSYSIENLEALDSQLPQPFEQYDGVKVLMKQDEQRSTALFAEYLGRKRFDVLLTCVAEPEWPRVYPTDLVGDVALVHVLTGYVTETMRKMATRWNRARPIDLGYRGSVQPLSFGRLGFEKRQIGYDVTRALSCRHGIRSDISSRPQDRIHGSAWIDFIAASKATLGVESGSNLFDFDGEVEKWCCGFEAAHLDMDPLSEEFYRLADEEYLWRFEGNVDYAQVSPRHFEAAAARSVQILYEGRYSDIFVPDRHFLPLARDLSNLNEAIDTLGDDRRCIDITECSAEEIVGNPKYGYEAFVTTVDAALAAALERKGRRQRRAARGPAGALPRALVLTAADPAQDPRSEWVANSLALDHEVCEIGTFRFGVDGGGPSFERLSTRRLRLRVEQSRHGSCWVPQPAGAGRTLSLGRQTLLYLAVLADASDAMLRALIGALDIVPEDTAQFRGLARHMLDANAALLEAAHRTGRFDLVVATDLDTLPAGVALREETGALLLYDAHEFWPYSWHGMRHWQCDFWAAFSRGLVAEADLAVTVSPPLAAVMTAEYGRQFDCLPNCAARTQGEIVDLERKLSSRAEQGAITFLYQGRFASGRGIDRLIAIWRHVGPNGRLLLRGPDNDYKAAMIELARAQGLLERQVFFPPAVDEDRLIEAASEADVGVIPYEPVNINNRLACPNKLSQYLAAGLPVVCNDLEFVRHVVVDNSIGHSVDFSDEHRAAAVFNKVIDARWEIEAMARRAQRYFAEHFHWEVFFEPLRRQIIEAERPRSPDHDPDGIDLDWIADPTAMRSRSAAEPESSRLLKVYAADFDRLNRHYPAEISRLTDEIDRLNEVYTTEIKRLHDVYPAEINRLHDVYATEINFYRSRLEWLIQIHRLYKIGNMRLKAFVQRLRKRERSAREI